MTQNMNGKVVLITGGARGMGRETARMLGGMGAHIIIVDWEGEHGTRLRDEINAGPGSAEFRFCELTRFDAVRELAADVIAAHDRLDVLFCNAGITDPVRRVTPEGYEHHLMTCHLSHFQLTHLLLDLLKSSAPARIILISSEAHKAGDGLDFDDLNNELIWKDHNKPSNSASFTAYHRAKLSNLYFMYELSERLAGSGVTINAISPGFFINTSIYRNLTGIFMLGARVIFGFGMLIGKSTPQRSARTYVKLATDPELQETTATYFEHEKVKETSALAKQEDPRKQLWAWSVEQTGVGG
jgi:NAD(P)-dependent dehydrogenase (short-subunit alcohol dehydrogenase family)